MTEIYVSNVPFSSAEIDVRTLLETWFGKGSVISCELRRDPLTWQHKGYGFVTFSDQDNADVLVCLAKEEDHEFVLQDRPLRFELSNRGSSSKNKNNGKQVEAGVLSLGFLTGGSLHVLWESDLDVKLEYDLANRKFSFLVDVQRDSRLRQYKLEFFYKYIYDICSASTVKGGVALILELINPPLVYKRMDEIDIWHGEDPQLSEMTDLMQVLNSPFENQGRWFRTVDFTPYCSIGHSLAYVLAFPETSVLNDVTHELGKGLKIPARPKQLTLNAPRGALQSPMLVPILSYPHTHRISFKLFFKLNHLVQVGSLQSSFLSDDFYALLSRTPTEHSLWVMQEILYSEKTVNNPIKWFKEALKRYESAAQGFPSSALISLEEGLIWVYRLLITPTKVYCMGPEVEISNRVTREYQDVLDNFLRVSFVDEDWETLPPAAVCLNNSERTLSGFQVGRSDIHDRVLKVLKDGFLLGGKKYEFLAFSSSQLREQSIWMFAPDYPVTAASIRSWMGDFLEIRNVAKCAARMGQCFSSSTKTLAVYPEEVEHLSDIIRHVGADKHCFSDGIGQISESFASVVAARCGCRKTCGRPPSAFQIRYGGYKGVVAVNPWSQYKLSLRPSMKKFESGHLYLEVIGWTRPLPCYLNRQVITLLSTLGLRETVFEEMQGSMVSKLNQLLENSQAAMEVLQATGSGVSHAVTVEMLRAGYHPQSEPYLLGLLQSFRASQLARVRSKARILVPKGRCLLGCLDEGAQLAYGQVFLQVSSNLRRQSYVNDGLEDFRSYLQHNDNNGTYVVTGPVVVAKNPCYHPGDIRVLEAVNIPQLSHMVDCVVFPQRGHRPHPNECSGSDLDGDLYFVTWDPLLIPPTMNEPMSYTAARTCELNRDVTTEDIQEFFIQYMVNDSVGLIGNAHTVLADTSEDMARDPKCLELARLFSVAVDFPKTGEAAVIPRDLRPQRYPDFMGKDKKVTYESEKILGKLYRSLSPLMHTFKTSFTKAEIGNFFDQDLILEGDSFREYLDEAWKLKMCYDMKLLSLMDQYDIKTEMEAISGNFSSPSKYFMRRQSEVKERIRMAVSSLRKEARSWFKSGYHSSEGYQIDESIELTEWEKVSKASAWYYVSYHPDYVFKEGIAKGKHEDITLISFPWTIHETLLVIKKSRSEILS